MNTHIESKKSQTGFSLLPVAIMISVIASIAFLISNQGAMSTRNIALQTESTNATYVAQAGLHHAVWQANNSGCSGYELASTDFHSDSYSATFTPTEISPVSVTATGTLANGVSHSVTQTNVKIYNPTTQTVVLQPGGEGIDSFIESQDGHRDHNKETDDYIKVDSEDIKTYRTLMQFDLSAIPAAVTVESAILELYLDHTKGQNDQIQAHALTRTWDEAEVTWEQYENSSDWTTEGGDYQQEHSGVFTPTGIGWNSLDITDMTDAWVNKLSPNYGLILVAQPASGNNVKEFFSSDATNSNLRPKFTITYKCECGTGPCAAPPSQEPIAHWMFDETSGLLAEDAASIHDGALTAGATWAAGIQDGGILLDGVDDYIDVKHSDALSLSNAMTFSAWAQTNDVAAGYQTIIEKDEIKDNESNYWLGIENNELVFGFYSSGGFREIKSSGANLLPNVWYHFTASFDNATNEVILYINGVQAAVGLLAFEPVIDAGNISIGRSLYGEYWNGILDEVRIYNRLLSMDEIATLSEPPKSNANAHWKLDESNGIVASDSVGSHDGTLINGPVWSADGRVDGALVFDGSNDQILVAHQDTLSFTTAMTMSAWVKNDSPSYSSSYRILSKETLGRSDNYWLSFQSGWLWVGIGGEYFSSADFLLPNEWYHVAATFDSDVGEVRMYINGIQTLSQATSTELNVNADPLYIGSNWEGTKYWDGLLDDVRLYDRALTEDEIAVLIGTGALTEKNILADVSAINSVECIGIFRDEFNLAESYSGSDGTLSWKTNWLEVNESDGPGAGDERIVNDNHAFVLQIRDNDGGGEGVQRAADLSAYKNATFSFAYRRDGFDNNNDYITVQVSNNGGSSWQDLEQIGGRGTDNNYIDKSYDISSDISADTRVQFITSLNLGSSDVFYIDNVSIGVSGCAE